LKPLEGEFFRLQTMKKMDDDMATFLKNEESMRDVNESSLEKVTWFSIASILFLVGLGLFQLFLLKGFFIAKKLI
jgi:p24 family protein delta-1